MSTCSKRSSYVFWDGAVYGKRAVCFLGMCVDSQKMPASTDILSTFIKCVVRFWGRLRIYVPTIKSKHMSRLFFWHGLQCADAWRNTLSNCTNKRRVFWDRIYVPRLKFEHSLQRAEYLKHACFYSLQEASPNTNESNHMCKHIVHCLRMMGVTDDALVELFFSPTQYEMYEMLSHAPDIIDNHRWKSSRKLQPPFVVLYVHIKHASLRGSRDIV